MKNSLISFMRFSLGGEEQGGKESEHIWRLGESIGLRDLLFIAFFVAVELCTVFMYFY